MMRNRSGGLILAFVAGLLVPNAATAACCYFSARGMDVLQPGQKAFITWDPAGKIESFTVQPKFEGNALDFGMVIPTPSQPKLDEMPRDFFKHLAVFGMLKKREMARSRFLPDNPDRPRGILMIPLQTLGSKSQVRVLESGVVGSLDYKIVEAGRADHLFQWLKDHKYHYEGDDATLQFYVRKKWVFTVMKIDTLQMKKGKDGSYVGEVTPTRFQFRTDKLVYPLRITQLSVKDKTEALFYVQAPYKVDLPGDLTYQYQWLPMLQSASGCTPGGLPGKGADWLKAAEPNLPALLHRSQELGFTFVAGQRPMPNAQGRTPTTMEWARRLTEQDMKLLRGELPYSETVPDVDEGFKRADFKDPKRADMALKVIRQRLEQASKERPFGYLVREAPAAEVRQLRQLVGHLQVGAFLTKFRHVFTRDEMADDLFFVPARLGQAEDHSEYEEVLPTSPP
jgi:hypothetical protein